MFVNYFFKEDRNPVVYRGLRKTAFILCIETKKMNIILVIRLYFSLDALNISDCISLSLGATFISCTSHLVYGGIYQMRCTAYKVAPDDGLT